MENTKPHASQIRYGSGDNRVDKTLKRSVLSFDDYATASAAAATLPDWQVVCDDESSSFYVVQGGELQFKKLFLEAQLAQSSGATKVAHRYSADAIDRSVAQILTGLSVSAESFGAFPGVSDPAVRAAIQKAIDYVSLLGGGSVRFETNGTYRLTSRLYWRDNVLLVGRGNTRLKSISSVDDCVIVPENRDVNSAVKNIGSIGIIFDQDCQNQPRTTAVSCVLIDPCVGAYFEKSQFTGSSGYGIAAQQDPVTNAFDNNRAKDVVIIDCKSYSNGVGALSGGDTFDGLDFKNCDGLYIRNFESFLNSDKGIDIRGDNIHITDISVRNNGGDGLGVYTSPTAGGSSYIAGVKSKSNGGHGGIFGFYAQAVTDAWYTADISGFTSVANGQDGLNLQTNNSRAIVKIQATCRDNGRHGLNLTGSLSDGAVIAMGCVALKNTSSGFEVNGNRIQVIGGFARGNQYGLKESGGAQNFVGGGFVALGNTTKNIEILAGSNTRVDQNVLDYNLNSPTNGDIIASAATISLPAGGQSFDITGTQQVQTIVPLVRGRTINLRLSGSDGAVPSFLHGGAGNLILAGSANFSPTRPGSSLTLTCNGASWFEVSRMVR